MYKLFSQVESQSAIDKMLQALETLVPQSKFGEERNGIIKRVLSAMKEGPKLWDEHCQINIKWIGNQFISSLINDVVDDNDERLDKVCSGCYRFLQEFDYSIRENLSSDFSDSLEFVYKHINNFHPSAREEIEYARNKMPTAILKSIINSDSIASIKEFNSIHVKSEESKKAWASDLEKHEGKVDSLKASLEKYENGYNFVGLYQGFDELSSDKKTEKEKVLFWLRLVSVLVVFPMLAELVFVYTRYDILIEQKSLIYMSLVPAISIFGVSLYYFKILLASYKSIKSQILQIELRKTLCRFVQNYATYSKEIKESNSEMLSRFEGVVFSNIVSDEEKIPSGLEGVDQLSKLIKNFRS